jgi:hypothetical protein
MSGRMLHTAKGKKVTFQGSGRTTGDTAATLMPERNQTKTRTRNIIHDYQCPSLARLD